MYDDEILTFAFVIGAIGAVVGGVASFVWSGGLAILLGPAIPLLFAIPGAVVFGIAWLIAKAFVSIRFIERWISEIRWQRYLKKTPSLHLPSR